MVFLALTFYASNGNINYYNKTFSESQFTWMKVIHILRKKKKHFQLLEKYPARCEPFFTILLSTTRHISLEGLTVIIKICHISRKKTDFTKSTEGTSETT